MRDADAAAALAATSVSGSGFTRRRRNECDELWDQIRNAISTYTDAAVNPIKRPSRGIVIKQCNNLYAGSSVHSEDVCPDQIGLHRVKRSHQRHRTRT